MATTSDSSSTPEPETFTTLIAWGNNGNGQLGNGTTTDSCTPVKVSDLVGVRDTAAGHSYSLALKDDGTVWAWGSNDAGQLGNGTTIDSSTPVEVKDPNDPSGYLSGVQAIAAGHSHSLALKDDGTFWAWGDNRFGQLGDGTTISSNTPVEVGNLNGVEAMAAGSLHSLALKNDGTVWAWGQNRNGQLGNGTTIDSSTPVEVKDPNDPSGYLSGVQAIAANDNFYSLALKDDGTVWAWGVNSEGQLGNGTITNHSSTPVQVSNLDRVRDIAGGFLCSLALKDDGTVWAWGDNTRGQLGNGTTTPSSTPVQVSEMGGITAIAAGGSHGLALKDDGTVWAWGANSKGQLGNGTTTDSSTPGQVSEVGGITAIAASGAHSLAVQL